MTLPAIQSGPLFSIEMLHEEYGRQIIRVDSKQSDAYREVRLRPVASIKGRLASENPEWVRNVKLAFTHLQSGSMERARGGGRGCHRLRGQLSSTHDRERWAAPHLRPG